MAVRGTASDNAKWEVSQRYLTGQIDRATHRTIVMHQLRPNLKLGAEWNPGAGEVGFVANWRAVPEAKVRPAVMFGTTLIDQRPDVARRFMLAYVRGCRDYYEGMKRQFSAMAEAAATATGTTVQVTYSGGATTMRNVGWSAASGSARNAAVTCGIVAYRAR